MSLLGKKRSGIYQVEAFAMIGDVVAEAIALAAKRKQIVVCNFNGVLVRVAADSSMQLLYRDYHRARKGYISKDIGPHPSAVLTSEEIANDHLIEEQNQQMAQQRQATENTHFIARYDALQTRLAEAPEMEISDQAAWQTAQDSVQTPQDQMVMRFVQAWARLMQLEMANGKQLEDIAEPATEEADIEGMSLATFDGAVTILVMCWKHGPRLQQWHRTRTRQ